MYPEKFIRDHVVYYFSLSYHHQEKLAMHLLQQKHNW